MPQNVMLRIDSTANVKYSKQLQQLHRSGIPNAIRNTLNRAAFDVKTDTMPEEAMQFIHRTKNFYKANSKVQPAKGYQVSKMAATVGFVENRGTQSQAVDDQKMQDEGGEVGSRTFIPVDNARHEGENTKMVKAQNRLRKIKKKIIDSKDTPTKGGSAGNKQQFIKAAYKAKASGGLIIGNFRDAKGNRMLWRIISMSKVNGRTKMKLDPLYTVREGRKVMEKATHFFRTASLDSAAKMEGFYAIEAQKQITRLTK